MTAERVVEPGTRIHCGRGQVLEVTDYTAVGVGDVLYCTIRWIESRDERKRAWDSRSWWRKLFDMPPKGYEPYVEPVQSIFGSLFGSLFTPSR